MDSVNRGYQARYLQARGHADAEEIQQCLDICWELGLKPDLSLYRRALVNLLIVNVAGAREHPNVKKFVREAIELIAQIRRDHLYNASDPSQEAELAKVEQHARSAMESIEAEIAVM